jgi:type II secretory pathway component GspD/PulD (secretin)
MNIRKAAVCHQSIDCRSIDFAGSLCLALALAFPVHSALAQTNQDQSGSAKPAQSYRTFYLTHATENGDGVEITTVLRNILQRDRIVYVHFQNALTVYGPADDLLLAHQIISDLDRPSQSWRVTYTFNQTGGDHPGTQHISVVVTSGSKTDVRQGTRVPIITGTYGKDSAPADSTQVQYVDVGMNLSAGLDGPADALHLRTKIEFSSLSDDKSGIGAQDPLIRQTVLQGTLNVASGKPLALGSFDLPGTSRHEEVTVTVEPIP